MHFQVHKNVIPLDIVNQIVDFFNKNDDIKENKNYMEKINKPWQYPVVNQLDKILKNFLDTSNNFGDNIYKHSYAYFPHTDTDPVHDTINALIPLYVEGNKYQPFVIFDQYSTNKNAKTWMIQDDKDTSFKKNIVEKNSIFEDNDIVGCVDKEIDEEFYTKYLENNFRPRSLFYGLTGTAVDFVPGNLIMFNSNHIHATGKMLADFKIGLVLRFKGKLQ